MYDETIRDIETIFSKTRDETDGYTINVINRYQCLLLDIISVLNSNNGDFGLKFRSEIGHNDSHHNSHNTQHNTQHIATLTLGTPTTTHKSHATRGKHQISEHMVHSMMITYDDFTYICCLFFV